MDPTTGASTWALGSHRWNIKIGNLTIKTITIAIHQKLIEDGLFKGMEDIDIKLKLGFEMVDNINILDNIGRELVIVYSIKYKDAWNRSGW